MPSVGVADLFAQLATDARTMVSAEVELQKARLSDRMTSYKSAAISLAIAGVLALATLTAALGGVILTLTPHVGPGFATLIVVAVMGAIVALLALKGLNALKPSELDKQA